MEKATLEKLLERKMNRQQILTKEIEVPEIGLSFVVQKKSVTEFLRIMNGYKDQENSLEANYEMFKELIYLSVPVMQSKKLQEAYECHEPYDIVPALLDDNLGAISYLANAIIELYGLNSGSVAEELKN